MLAGRSGRSDPGVLAAAIIVLAAAIIDVETTGTNPYRDRIIERHLPLRIRPSERVDLQSSRLLGTVLFAG